MSAVLLEIQQAKNADTEPPFLQVVAKPGRVASKAKPEPKLTRFAFAVSRLMEFCNRRELQNQTGHSVHDWPLVVAKELFDNGLDGCEEAEVAPNITVIVEPNRIIVQDNANGITTGPSSRFSTTRSGSQAAKHMSRRPAARRATH